MKTHCVMFLMVAGVVANGLSAPAETPAPAPKIEFDSTSFNFGKINQGEVVKHDFVFTNTGTANLEITAVRPGCGCTTAGTWDKLVEPGKTGIIPLQFNSAHFGGTISKSASVTCNDPGRSNLVLLISGTVWKPIDLTPITTIFNYGSDGQTNETKVVRIVNNTEEPLTVSDLQCTNASFHAELKTVKPGKEYEVHITAIPPFIGRTTIAPLSVKTSDAKSPILNFTAYVMVQPDVVVTPEQLFLPVGPLTASMTPLVSIRSTGTNVLTLSEPSTTVPGATVKVQELQPGRLFNLAVTFPAGLQLPAGQRTEVTVKSNHPKFPLIKVSVIQPPAPAHVGQPKQTNTASLRTVPSKLGPPTAAGR